MVTGYVPAAAGGCAPAAAPPPLAFSDPRSGRAIAIEAAGHHMRVETLDPRWAQQRALADARRASAHDTLAGGDEVADNLRRLAAARGDVFRDAPVAGGLMPGAGPGQGLEGVGAAEPAPKRQKQ